MLNRVSGNGQVIVPKSLRKGIITFETNGKTSQMEEGLFYELFPNVEKEKVKVIVQSVFENKKEKKNKLFFHSEDSRASVETSYCLPLEANYAVVDIAGLWKSAKEVAHDIQNELVESEMRSAKVNLMPELRYVKLMHDENGEAKSYISVSIEIS